MPNATSLLKGGLRAVNLGAERFCDDLRSQPGGALRPR